MASFLGNKQTVESYATEAVPQSLQGNDSPMAMKGKVTQVAVQCTTGNQTASGKLRFVLPNNNSSISRRSMFLRARVSVAFKATLPALSGDVGFNIWFQGPGPMMYTQMIGGGTPLAQTGQTLGNAIEGPILGNAYSLIQRSTIYSGGKVIDDTNYVCDLMSGLILPHATNLNWLASDGQILLGINTQPLKSTSLTTGGFIYWDVCIPITHSCFNSQQDFPLYMLSESNPLSLEIDLTTFNRAIAWGNTVNNNPPNPSNYLISRAALCYEQIELPREFIDLQRHNTSFVIPQLSYLINQMPISALVNYNTVLNMSSLRAAYILPYNNSTYVSNMATTMRFFSYQRNTGDIALNATVGDETGTNVQLFIDDRCINQVNIDNTTMTFVALKQALKGSITDILSSSVCTAGLYRSSHYAIGIDTTAFSDGSTMMGGTPVNEAKIVLTNFIASGTGAYLANLIFAYDSLIIIKNGKITVKR